MSDLAAALKANPDALRDPKVQQALRLLADARKNNPLASYFPHEKQREFHEAKTPVKAFFGGNRSGKTHCSVADDVIQAIDREAVPQHLLDYKKWEPPFKCWIGVQKHSKIEEVILPKLRHLIPKDQLINGAFDKSYSKQDKILKLRNGSFFGFKSYDQDLDAWAGADLHRVHFDEEPEGEHGERIWQEARARLIDYAGDVTFSMTPLFGLSFVYDQVYEKRNEPHVTVVTADMDDNPHLDQAAKEAFLESLPEEFREARKSGHFVHFKGLVYGEFGDAHIVDPPSKSHIKGQDVIVGIDPGYRTTAVIFLAFDKENMAVVFDELYLHRDQALPGPAAEQIKLVLSKWGITDARYVIDPAATNAALTAQGENVEGAYHREGILVSRANNKVEAGILETKRRLQHDPPALLISRECTALLTEISKYRLDDSEEGVFKVVKVNDHACDAMRYALMERTWWQATEDPAPRPPQTFIQNFQPPYSTERPVRDSSPTGIFT